jgi:CRISPR-associated protein Csx17
MWLSVPTGVEELANDLAACVKDSRVSVLTPIKTPWRGKGAPGFGSLRNAADDQELAWFDACAVARVQDSDAGGAQSDKVNNPLLGQGGGFGRGEIAAAHGDAVARLTRAKSVAISGRALLGLVTETIIEPSGVSLATQKKALGAYQSGRATGPGASVADGEPTTQKASTPAWDLVLVLEGLTAFRGMTTSRARNPVAARGSFPLVSRARVAGTGSATLAEDPDDAYEFLAPLWSAPVTGRALLFTLKRARLRTPRGMAADVIEGALSQAAHSAGRIALDRLTRFAFLAPSDPRYRFASRRGALHAAGSSVAVTAMNDVVPFMRSLGRAPGSSPESFRLAVRRLNEALVAMAQPEETEPTRSRQAQATLIALADAELPAARLSPPPTPARLSRSWWRLCRDDTAPTRLAMAIVSARTVDGRPWLRPWLRPQTRADGRWSLDPSVAIPSPERAHDPLRQLARALIHALRREPLGEWTSAEVGLSDLVWLTRGPAPDDAVRVTRLVKAFSGLPVVSNATTMLQAHSLRSIGLDLSRFLLAANPHLADLGPRRDGCRLELAALVVDERIGDARVLVDRELAARELSLLPGPPYNAPSPGPWGALSLAVLLPLNPALLSHLAQTASRERPPKGS